MTKAQQTALRHIAMLAEECAHPRFGTETALGSVFLTVNSGFE